MGKRYTKDFIKQKLEESQAWVERAVVSLYEQQTTEEQDAKITKQHNQRGFSALDAEFGSNLAEWVLKGIREYKRKYGACFTPKQLVAARKLLRRYCTQLAKIANGELNTRNVTCSCCGNKFFEGKNFQREIDGRTMTLCCECQRLKDEELVHRATIHALQGEPLQDTLFKEGEE